MTADTARRWRAEGGEAISWLLRDHDPDFILEVRMVNGSIETAQRAADYLNALEEAAGALEMTAHLDAGLSNVSPVTMRKSRAAALARLRELRGEPL